MLVEGHDLRGRVALVLGSGGFIGQHVARQLAMSGALVHGTFRPERRAHITQVARYATPHGVDLCDERAVCALLRSLKPDLVFNIAGYGVKAGEGDPNQALAINAELPRILGQTMLESASGWPGCRLIHAGSALEYGLAAGDLDEATLPQPDTLYGRTKLQGTLAVREAARAGLSAVTARLFNVYGPLQHSTKLLPTLIDAARAHAPIPLSAGTQRRDFIYVADVAEGLIRLATSPPGPPVINLATGALAPVRSFVMEAARQLRIPPHRLRFGVRPIQASEMAHGPVTVARLTERTGWCPPTSIAEGIARTLAFQEGECA